MWPESLTNKAIFTLTSLSFGLKFHGDNEEKVLKRNLMKKIILNSVEIQLFVNIIGVQIVRNLFLKLHWRRFLEAIFAFQNEFYMKL